MCRVCTVNCLCTTHNTPQPPTPTRHDKPVTVTVTAENSHANNSQPPAQPSSNEATMDHGNVRHKATSLTWPVPP